jgi:hypothetical protein
VNTSHELFCFHASILNWPQAAIGRLPGSDHGQVRFLQLHHGNRPISIAELEAMNAGGAEGGSWESVVDIPALAYKRNTMPAVLTVRLTKEEQGILARRSKRAGLKKATFVRKLIRDEEIVTGADLLSWAERHAGDERLRITLRK